MKVYGKWMDRSTKSVAFAFSVLKHLISVESQFGLCVLSIVYIVLVVINKDNPASHRYVVKKVKSGCIG